MQYPQYKVLKDTEIHWIPQQPSHWDIKRLRFVLKVNPVKSAVANLDDETMVSFVPMESVGENGGMDVSLVKTISEVYSGYTYFTEGDTVVAKITPCFENGKGAISRNLENGIGFGTTEFHVLKAGDGMDESFQFYLTISHPFRDLGASEMLGAGGQKRIPEDFIKDFRLGTPPLDEQQKIARFLDHKTRKIDQLIEKKKALIEKLDEQRIAVITQAVTKGLNENAKMKPSGVNWLGDIPKHWTFKRLRFLSKGIEQGWSPQCDSNPANEGEWGVLKVGCVNGNHLDVSENKALPINLSPRKEYEIVSGDILISRANTKELLGSAAIAPDDVREKLILCDKLYRLIPTQEISPMFLLFVLRIPISRFQYEREATGASGSMQNIGQDTIKNLLIPVPPMDEQLSIINLLEENLKRIDRMAVFNKKTIDRLQEYRSALITNAVTGKIDVRNIKIPMGE